MQDARNSRTGIGVLGPASGLLVVLLACGGAEAPKTESPVLNAIEAKQKVDDDGQIRFFGIEEFTVVRELEGMPRGKVTEHVRAWGRERVEIQELEVGFGDFTQKQHHRVIHKGEWITTIDLDANDAIRTKNPVYLDLAKSGAQELGRKMMDQMGAASTGEFEDVAGERCEVFEVEPMQQTICITEDGLTLRQANSLSGTSETVVEFRRGDPGPDDAYEIPDGVEVEEGPDIEELLRSMERG